MMLRRTLAVLAALVAACAVAASPNAGGRRVTLAANHTVAENGIPVLLAGTVSSGRRGEAVTIEQDECGPAPWRPVRTVRTGVGGGWSSYAASDVGIRLRARWRGALSRVIHVAARPEIELSPGGNRLHVLVRAAVYLPGARVLLQAFRGGSWKTTATARLTRLGAAGQFAQSGADFTAPRKHGTYHALLPNGSAAPCYVGAASAPLEV